MKSAYERALERFGGGPIKELSDEQKAEIAEIDKKLQANLAQADLSRQDKLAAAAGNLSDIERINQEYNIDVARYKDRAESAKRKVRGE